ncbi:MAG: N-acetylmuramoyl-L-alanine amidase [bacterium]|nr:N-acetylmuramoyl-L-alanine amidase [bacterium]
MTYLDVNSFSKAVDVPFKVNPERQFIQMEVNSVSLKLSADNVFVVAGDEVLQWPREVLYSDGKYWAPLDHFMKMFFRVYPGDVEYNPKTLTTVVKPGQYDVYGIQYDRKDNGTLIRLSTSKQFDASGTSISNGYLSFTIMDAKVNKRALEATRPEGAISQLIIHEHANSVQFTFKLTTEILDHLIWQEQNPNQIVVSLVTNILTPETVAETPSTLSDSLDHLLAVEQEKWKINCVVIDPGHGGQDPGAVGLTGLKEKEVTLSVALKLKELLETHTDLKVVLTRKDDHFIALNERTSKANRAGGKLFISIHCNSSKQRKAHGFETYFLKPARNERAMEAALLENSVIKYEQSKTQYQDLTEENYILLAMAQAEFVHESEALADIIQSQLGQQTKLSDRGVDQAGFYVLVGASMPAVLVEMPFISNKPEEKLLKKKDFQQKLAQALFDSITDFKERDQQRQQNHPNDRP